MQAIERAIFNIVPLFATNQDSWSAFERVACKVMDGRMVYWVARAARQAREEAGAKQVQVAATLDRDQSLVVRFETGRSWPRDPDAIVAAYAKTVGVPPQEIWRRAIELWTASNGSSA